MGHDRRAALRFLVATLLLLAGCGGASTQDGSGREKASRGPGIVAAGGCGPTVTVRGSQLLVEPTGGDDTANLSCALAHGNGKQVRLQAGVFHLGQVVADDFRGDLSGAGMDATILRNLETPLPVTPVDPNASPPSAANPWPSLLAFNGGAFTISDLAIEIQGQQPTTGWSILGIPTPIKALAHAIVIVGAAADATVARIRVSGEDLPGDFAGVNLINGIFYEGFTALDPPPITGSFTVKDSVFRHHVSGAPVVNLRNAQVRIIGNRFEEMLVGAEVSDVEDSTWQFSGNTVEAAWNTMTSYDLCLGPSAVCGFSGSRLLVTGNILKGSSLSIDGTFGATTRCTIAGNTLIEAGAPQLTLAAGTRNVLAVGFSSFVDLGTGNRVLP